MYITFDEYCRMSGVDIAIDKFERLQFRAEKFIDRITLGRVKGETPVRDAVKRLACELVTYYGNSEGYNGQNVSSMSNDGVSVTFSNSAMSQERILAATLLFGEVDANGESLIYMGV